MCKLVLIYGAIYTEVVQRGALWCIISLCFLIIVFGQQIHKVDND